MIIIMCCQLFLGTVYNIMLNTASMEVILIHNLSSANSMNTTSLHTFVSDECLMFGMTSENCINIDYTLWSK